MSDSSWSSLFRADKVLNTTARLTGYSGLRVPEGGDARFTRFIKRIAGCTSQSMEHTLVKTELQQIQQTLATDDSANTLRNCLLCVAYCQLLGHNVGAFVPNAVAFVQRAERIADKRAGYVLATLLLDEQHEMSLMLVNAMLQDLKSFDEEKIALTLSAMTELMNADIATAVTPAVAALLSHASELVRQRAILVLSRVHSCAPEMLAPYHEQVVALLDDPHVGVVYAATGFIQQQARKHRTAYKHLALQLAGLLRVIAGDRLSEEYYYHQIAVPWFQLRLLRLLAELVYDDEELSRKIAPDILFTLERAQAGVDAAYAIIYECVRTLTRLAIPSTLYVNSAARPFDTPTRLLRSRNANLRYLGLSILGEIVRVEPGQIEEHQHVLVSCLDAADINLRRLASTLDLLYEVTTTHNVAVVVEKMFEAISSSNASERWWRHHLIQRILSLMLRVAPDATWFANTLIRMLSVCSDNEESNLITDEEMDRVMRYIGQDSHLPGVSLQQACLLACIKAIGSAQKQKPKHALHLIHLTIWLLGEYGDSALDADRCQQGLALLMSLYQQTLDATERQTSRQLQGELTLAIGKLMGNGHRPEYLGILQTKGSTTVARELTEIITHFDALQQLTRVLPAGVYYDYLDANELLTQVRDNVDGEVTFDMTRTIAQPMSTPSSSVGIRTTAYAPPQWSAGATKAAITGMDMRGKSGTATDPRNHDDAALWQSATLSAYRPSSVQTAALPAARTQRWTRQGYSQPVVQPAPANSPPTSTTTTSAAATAAVIPVQVEDDASETDQLLKEQRDLAAILFGAHHTKK